MFVAIRKRLVFLSLIMFALTGGLPAAADTPAQPDTAVASEAPSQMSEQQLAEIATRFEERFPGAQVDHIRQTPLPWLFEVQLGVDLVYTDADVNYVIQGALIDAQTRNDLTASRIAQLTRVDFNTLPFDLAIPFVKGTGERKLVVFEDPYCEYCEQLHRTLEDVDNITVYSLLFPVLSPDSVEMARDIWCAENPSQAWKAWMLKREEPEHQECSAPIEEVLELGRELKVQGTPAIIFSDGSRVNGAMPVSELEERLEAVHAKQVQPLNPETDS